MKLDPIIAVVDVVKSSQWYQQLLSCRSMHGGGEFDILVDDEGEVFYVFISGERMSIQRSQILVWVPGMV